MINRIFVIISAFLFFVKSSVFAKAPTVNCYWLPGCTDWSKIPSPPTVVQNVWAEVIWSIIWYAIQFVAVVAVITLILSGVMYLISWWEEEKVNKAKKWIIWSLAWVFLSISAWAIINMINKITIW